jgi:hypothetical protein
MRKKAANQDLTDSLLSKMKEASGKTGFALTASDIIDRGYIEYGDTVQLKHLFELIISNKLHTAFHPRMQQQVVVVLLKPGAKVVQVDQDDLSNMIQWFCLYLALSKTPTITGFHSLSQSKYKEHTLFSHELTKELSVTEWKILAGTILGYLTGYHPVYLSNIKLPPRELAEYTLVLAENKSALSNLNTIHFSADSDGINYRASMNRLTLNLILDKQACAALQKNNISSSLAHYIPFSEIDDIPMCYEKSTGKLFQSFTKLIDTSYDSTNFHLSVLLHGPSGTGKTGFVKHLAKTIKADIFQVDFSTIQSKWIGETEKNIKMVFEEYQRIRAASKSPLILLFNEADGLMNKRVALQTSTDVFSNHAQTQLLETLEHFKGILMATTNLFSQFDSAFHRRFLFKIHIGHPDISVRKTLWGRSSLSGKIAAKHHADVLAGNWSAAQLDIVEKKVTLLSKVDILNEDDILFMMQEEGLLSRYRAIGFNTTKTYTKHEPHK